MTRRRHKRRAEQRDFNPNLLPVSPKRGMAGASAPSSNSERSAASQTSSSIETISNDLRTIRTADSDPPSSPSIRTGRRTRSANTSNFSALPTRSDIRNKRQWTVVRELGRSDDGNRVRVQWKDTVVSGRCLRMNKKGRMYMKARGKRHYIAKSSRGECDDQGRAMWNCKWKPSTISRRNLREYLQKSSAEVDGHSSDISHASESDVSSGSSSDADSDDSPVSSSDSDSDSDSDSEDSSASSSNSDHDSATVSTPSQSTASSRTSSLPSQALFSGDSPSTPRQSIEAEQATQPERSSTVSTLYFGGPPNPRPEGLHFAVISDTADYGPDVHSLIAENLGIEIKTPNNQIPYVVERRLGRKTVRPLHWKRWTRGRKKHSINLQEHQNAEAVLAHMQGDDVVEPCNRCAKGRGVMQGCIVAEDFGKGECTNCHYGRRGARCCFRKDTKDEQGYRPAKVVKHRSVDGPALRRRPDRDRLPSRTPPPSSPLQQANSASQNTPDVHRNLQFSARDFVYSADPSSSNSAGRSDQYIMSGGLGEATSSPTPNQTRGRYRRSRSRSSDSLDSDVPLTKRSKLTTAAERIIIDLISPEKAKPEKPRTNKQTNGRQSSDVGTARSRGSTKRAPIPAGHAPVPTSSTSDDSDNSKPTGKTAAAQHAPREACSSSSTAAPVSVRSPEIATSGRPATSSTARLKQRRRNAAQDISTSSKSQDGKNESSRSDSGHACSASTARGCSSENPSNTGSTSGDVERNVAAQHVSGHSTSWRSAGRDTPKFGESGKLHALVGPNIDQVQVQPVTTDTGNGFAARPTARTGKSKPAPESAPVSEPQHSGTSGKHQRQSNTASAKGKSRISGTTATSNEMSSSGAGDSRSKSGPASKQHGSRPVAAEKPETIAHKLQHSPPPQGEQVQGAETEVIPPDGKRQCIAYGKQEFRRNELSAEQFSYIWHRSDFRAQRSMRRLLCWAWFEKRVPPTTSLAEMFAGLDVERGWLNDHVIPTFCPRRRTLAISLDGSSSSSEGEDGDDETDGDDEPDGYVEIVQEGEKATSKNAMVLPAKAFGEDSEWEGSAAGSESSDEDSDDEDDAEDDEESDSSSSSSDSESSVATGASEESSDK